MLYVSLNRLGWSLALSWVLISCVKGRGGVVNQLLGWGGLVPLARLSYCMYLSHITVVVWYSSIARDAVTFTFPLYVYYCLANLLVTGGVATLLVLVFEMPIVHLEKLVFALVGLNSWPKGNTYIIEEKKEKSAILF